MKRYFFSIYALFFLSFILLLNTGMSFADASVKTNQLLPIILSPASLPNVTAGVPYSQTITASGGTAPYTYVVLTGALPPGITLGGSSGILSGTTTLTGTFNVTIQATDALTFSGSQPYTLTVTPPTITLNPASLPNATVGASYSQAITASGGTAPYAYTVTAGALPPGLGIAANGVLSGMPTASGAFSFTITATDSTSNTGSRAYTITTISPTIILSPASLANATVGSSYSQTITASGGSAPYVYTLTAGSLPSGLNFSSSGVLSGTAEVSGAFGFTVTVSDAFGNQNSQSYNLLVSLTRPNPVEDAVMKGMINAQVVAAQLLAQTQLTQVTDHLHQLHQHFNVRKNNLNVNFKTPALTEFQSVIAHSAEASSRVPSQQLMVSPAMQVKPANSSKLPGINEWLDGLSANTLLLGKYPMALWASGSLNYGKLNEYATSNHFTLEGITSGLDIQLLKKLIIGAALGYDNNTGRIKGHDNFFSGSMDAHFWSGNTYASYQFKEHCFLDALIGYGSSTFNNERRSVFNGNYVNGDRHGDIVYGSIGLSNLFKLYSVSAQPFVRSDIISTRLQQYSENGSQASALTYAPMSVTNVSIATGFYVSQSMLFEFGQITPSLKVQYTHNAGTTNNQNLFYTYAGSTGLNYNFGAGNIPVNTGSLGAWINFTKKAKLRLDLGWEGSIGSNNFEMNSVQMRVAYGFDS